MSQNVRVYKSAVDGKFYKANYTERGRNASLTAGGIVSPSDVEAVEAVTILEQVLGLLLQRALDVKMLLCP